MSNYIKLECRANTENELMVRYMVGFFLSTINPTINELTEIKTIISEAMINSIIHGYENSEDGKIIVEMELIDHTLLLMIKDYGCGINDLNLAKQPLYTTKPELERSGMGITIMESLADSFEILSKKDEGTTVKVSKTFRGSNDFNN